MKKTIPFVLFLALAVVPYCSQGQLVDNGNGTITDLSRGLMWLKDLSHLSSGVTWDQAMQWADTLTFAGYDDWRLPRQTSTLDELLSVASYTDLKEGRPFDNVHGPTGYLWTSDEVPPDKAWALDWSRLDRNSIPKSTLANAWAVRTIPGGAPAMNLDVWAKDTWRDGGAEPSNGSGESVDIFVNNSYTAVAEAPYGWYSTSPSTWDNTVKVWARNRCNAWVEAKVSLYSWKSSVAPNFSNSDRVLDGPKYVMLGPNERRVVAFDHVSIDNRARSGDQWSLGAVVSSWGDPPPTLPIDPTVSNNVATASLPFAVSREGQDTSLNWFQLWGKWLVVILFAALLMSLEWYIAQSRPHLKAGKT